MLIAQVQDVWQKAVIVLKFIDLVIDIGKHLCRLLVKKDT